MAKFGKSKYQIEGTWEEVRQRLAEMESSDSHAESQVSTGNKTAGWGCGILVVGVVLAMAQMNQVGAVVAGLGLCIVVLGLIYNSLYSSFDLDNMRYKLPMKLLDSIAVDLDPGKTISVMIDFRASQSSQFVQKVEQSGVLFFKYGPKVTYYSHPWLELCATSADGHRIKLSVSREGTYKVVPKRKRTKTRLRYVDSVSLSVRPPGGQKLNVSPGTTLTPPNNSRFRTFRGQLTPQGAVVKAVGPHYYTISNRGTQSGGDHLVGNDLVVLMMSCFRGLVTQAGP